MKILVVLTLSIATTVLAEYPADFPKCHNGDADCLAKAANEVIQKYSAGLRDVNLVALEPLHLKTMVLERNPASPVNLELSFNDVDFYGFKAMKVTAFNGLKADLSGRNNFEATIPELRLKGLYKADGRVLVLPIVGNGPFEIKIKNVNIKYGFDFKKIPKNGETYAALVHTKLDMDVEHMHFHFDNLFNGNQELGEGLNKFINDNWHEIYDELKPSFTKAVSLVVKTVCNNFYDKHPFADHFL